MNVDSYQSYQLQQQQQYSGDNKYASGRGNDDISFYEAQVFEMSDDRLRNNVSENMLDKSFKPGAYDVICGRGRAAFNHVGNKRFRNLVDSKMPIYQKAKTKIEKSAIIHDVVSTIQYLCRDTSSGFVKFDYMAQCYYVVSDHHAREKASQALRDALSAYNKNEKKEKKKKNVSSKKRKHDDYENDLLQEHHNTTSNEVVAKKSKASVLVCDVRKHASENDTTTTNTTVLLSPTSMKTVGNAAA